MMKNLGRDLPSSIVVFLVALPLCLGIALASGAPPLAGLIAGIIGGLVVGSLSGSQVGVSGPAAGLAVIVLNGINSVPTYETFLLAVVIGGVVQILLGVLKAGVIGLYFPSSVIQGMLSAIGILIFFKQVPHALGYAGKEGVDGLLQGIGHATPTAVFIAAVGLGILLLWELPSMKARSFTRVLPGSLVAVLAGVGIHLLTRGEGGLSASQLVELPILHPSKWGDLVTLPDFSAIGNATVWTLGVTIALVASIETLLCVEATDKLDPEKRTTPTNRELLAQGVGNTLSGLVGGLPITQVIVRSSANLQSRNATKMSAILHGAWLLILFLLAPALLNLIPLASLAAVLFVVGYKLAKPAIFKTMYEKGFTHFVPFLSTIVAIVTTDLLLGIGIGLATSILCILLDHYQRPFVRYRFDANEGPAGTWFFQLSEDATFLHKAGLRQALGRVKPGARVILDATETLRMDSDVREVIDDFASRAADDGISIEIKSPADAEVTWILRDFLARNPA